MSDDDRPEGLTDQEAERVEERAEPRAPVIYEIIRRHGEEEMARPAVSLWWSGVAAGLSISFSLLAEAILHRYLPTGTPWRHLVVSLGYPVGFLMVVLGRQQLFTTNTITAVLPVMADPGLPQLLQLLRTWSVVFVANMAGTLFAALFCVFTPAVGPELRAAMLELSREAMAHGWLTMLFGGITAGFLIAAMVWLEPNAEGTRFHVVALMTYLVGVGNFSHIVAGSVEAFMLVVSGELGVGHMLAGFTLPVLVGNVVGGTVLFALISYAQVMKEL